MQRRYKHASSAWSVPRSYLEDSWRYSAVSCLEAGSNTSTVALLMLGGNEKGSLESETIKCCHESHGTRTRK
jgi:hypothetical protein